MSTPTATPKYDLKSKIERAMKGFHGLNPIAYKNKNEYVTYSRPADCLKNQKVDDMELQPDKKEMWPVLNDIHTPLPARLKRRPNRVDDASYTVPRSDRTPIQNFPPSKGLKLRPIDEIMNDTKLLGLKAAPTSSTTLSTATTSTAKKSTVTVRSSNKNHNHPAAFDTPSSKIQGVLDIITSASSAPKNKTNSRKNTTNHNSNSSSRSSTLKPPSNTNNSQASNRPRKSSLLKSEIIHSPPRQPSPPPQSVPPQQQMGSKKPMSSLSNNIRPRMSSKSTTIYNNNKKIPDLIEVRNYLLGDTDKVEFKKLDHLLEAKVPQNTQQRPVLFVHINSPIPALLKLALSASQKPTIAAAAPLPQNPVKQEKENVNSNNHHKKAIKEKATPNEKASKPIIPPPTPASISPPSNNKASLSNKKDSVKKESPIKKEAAPIKKEEAPIKEEEVPPPAEQPKTTEQVEKEVVYPSSIPAAFLRSMKIPKRKSSDVELEEGETISPSPSPHHSITPVPSQPQPTPLVKVSSKTREEEPSRKRRDSKEKPRRDRYEDRRKSIRHYRSKSRSRSRSPVRPRSPSRQRSPRQRSRSPRQRSRSPSKQRSPIRQSKKRPLSRERSPETRRERSSERREKSPERREKSLDRRKSTTSSKRDTSRSVESSTSKRKERDEVKREDSKRQKTESSRPAEKYTSNSSASSSKKNSPPPPVNASTPEKSISATASNAETPEQFKVFNLMFNKLALAHKRRGDTQTDSMLAIIDHFHAFCDYILSFYYADRLNPHVSLNKANAAWKSIFPFTDTLLKRLEARQEMELYGLCIRLNSLIRFYIYQRMENNTRPVLQQHVAGNSKLTDKACIELTNSLLYEHEKANRTYKDSEKYLNYSTIVKNYPETFKSVCTEGNLLVGITLGGEAGVAVQPMFPFSPYSALHHAAIASKCMLAEYVTKHTLKYTPISKLEEFM